MKSGNNHAHKISDSDTKIIESIVITLAITCYEYIENHDKHSAENLAKDYSRLGSSKSSKLAFTSLISNIYNVDYTKGHFPDEMNRQIARHLLKQNINYMRLPNLSKLLKKLETYGIFYRIEGKENIKAKSTESLPSRQKGKRDIERCEGYHIVRKTTPSTEGFKRIIANPKTLAVINQKLSEYRNLLKSFYELLVDDILEAIKKGNEQSYSFLTACFTATFPSINPDTVDWKSFKKNLESIPKEDLAVHKKAFVTNLLERPDPHFFFILSLAEYDA